MKSALFILALLVSVVLAEDWEYNTGGSIGFIATQVGSTGWAEWFVVTVENNTGHDVLMKEFGFPCAGDATDTLGWILYSNVGGANPPAGTPADCDWHGPFTPVEGPGGDPTVYTYVDVSGEGIIIPDGTYFSFGYQNTGFGGMTPFNGTATWSWFDGGTGYFWNPDANYSRTAVLQFMADYTDALQSATWGEIKTIF